MEQAPEKSKMIHLEWDPDPIDDRALGNFLQTHTREVPAIKRGNKERSVILIFNTEKSASFLKTKLRDDHFWKITTIREVPDACDVRVSNLHRSCRKMATVYNFFTNSHMCGVTIQSGLHVTRISADQDWCILSLDKPGEALDLIQKESKIKPMNSQKLKLSEFYQAVNTDDENISDDPSLPEPVRIEKIDPVKLDFLKKCYKEQLKVHMDCEKIVWPKENVYKLEFHFSSSTGRGDKGKWTENVKSTFTELMKSVEVVERKIQPVVWDAVVSQCTTSDVVMIKEDRPKLIIVGMKDSVELKRKLADIDGVKPPAKTVSKSTDVSDTLIDAFEKLSLKEEGEEQMGVRFQTGKGKIVTIGTENDVKDAETWLLDKLNDIQTRTFTFPGKEYGQILATPMMEDTIIASIDIPNNELRWRITDDTLDLYIRGQHPPEDIHRMIMELILEDEISREGTMSAKDAFIKKLKEVADKYDPYVKLSHEVNTGITIVKIVCGANYMGEVRTEVLQLFDELMNEKEVILIPENVFEYIQKNSIEKVTRELKGCGLKDKEVFKVDTDHKHVTVTGCKATRTKVREIVLKAAGNVQTSWRPVERDGVDQYFSEDKAIRFLREMESSYHCSINIATKVEMKNVEISCIVPLETGQALFAGTGDLIQPKMRVDAIMNPTSTSLEHDSSVHKKILRKAGKDVKLEIEERANKDQLKLGEVYVSGSGHLTCQRIMHAAMVDGPKAKGFDDGVVSRAMTNVLEAMDKETLRSVAIVLPDSGTVMAALQTLQEKLKRFPRVREIYFYDMQPNNVRGIKECMNRFFHSRCFHPPVQNIGLNKGMMTTTKKKNLQRSGKRVLPLPGEKRIVIEWGVLSETTADVLVNPTPDAPYPAGKVFHSLQTACGMKLNDNVSKAFKQTTQGHVADGTLVETLAGQLPCAKIFHIKIRDQWPGDKTFKDYIQTCLTNALREKHSSIAFPTIGTADCRYPGDKVAFTFIEAVSEFMNAHISSGLKEVKIVVYKTDNDLTQKFESIIEKIYSKRPHRLEAVIEETVVEEEDHKQQQQQAAPQPQYNPKPQKQRPKSPHPAHVPVPVPIQGGFPRFVINQQTTLILVTGNIEKAKADVLVATTSAFPKLNGIITKAIIAAGGHTVQTSLDNKYKSYPKQGVAEGSGGTLGCKIYYIELRDYKSKKDLQVIYNRVKDCLQKADADGCRSIAFPTLGAGNFKYPEKDSAENTYQAIKDFFAAGPKNLTQVTVVLYAGAQQTAQTFTTAIGKYFHAKGGPGGLAAPGGHGGQAGGQGGLAGGQGGGRGGHRGGQGALGPPALGRSFRPVSARGRDCSTLTITGTQTVIELRTGELQQWRADVILDTTTSFPNLNGAIPNVLCKAAGPKLKQECQNYQGHLIDGDIAVTGGHHLPCKKVFHYVMPGWNRATGEQLIQRCVGNCLQKMSTLGLSTIALPAIGTGGAKYDPDLVASGMYSAVETFAQSKPNSPFRMTVVQFGPAVQINQIFIDQLTNFKNRGKAAPQNPPNAAPPKKGVRFDDNPPGPKYPQPQAQPDKKREDFLLFRFTSDDPKNIDKAFADIEKKVKDESNEMKVDLKADELLLVKDNKKAFEKVAEETLVSVTINIDKKNIYVRGIGDRVSTCHKMVLQTLNELKTIRGQKAIGQHVHKYLEWCYEENSGNKPIWVPYPKHIAFSLEDAYTNKGSAVEFKDSDDKVYVVDLNAMTERLKDAKDNSSMVKVQRKDLAAETCALPALWKPMGELQIQEVVSLDSNDQEYKAVAGNLVQALNRQPNIKEIRRVQNKTLYQLYQTQKKKLQSKNPNLGNMPLERTLWHGGKEDIEVSIISNGFNRSYAGRTHGKIWYGCGSYFATQATYCDSRVEYTPPYNDGYKRIMQVTVLTGNTKAVPKNDKKIEDADHTDRVAPLLPNSNTDRYDSVCDNINNPTEMVIFNDTQAYPEYIIVYN